MPNNSDGPRSYREIGGKGRRKPIRICEPHSDFQLLVESHRKKQGISYQVLGEAVGVDRSTFWTWMHNERGVPSRGFDFDKDPDAIAKLLRIPAQEIRDAIDRSSPVYDRSGSVVREEDFDALAMLHDIFKNEKRVRVPTKYCIRLVETLMRGRKPAA